MALAPPGPPHRRRQRPAASVADLDVAVTMAAGALLALSQLLQDQPDRDVEETTTG
jgi:hypothetical protein